MTGSYDNCIFSCVEETNLEQLYHFPSLLMVSEHSISLHPHQHLVVLLFVTLGILIGVWQYRIVVLNCTYSAYSMTSKAERLFMCLSAVCISSSVACPACHCCSVVSDCLDCSIPGFPWTAAYQVSLSFTISWSLLKLMSIDSVVSSHPLSSPSPLALNLSQHQGLFQ